MLTIRPILLIVGVLLSIFSAGMVIPALADLIIGHPNWQGFAISSFITAFFGVSLVLTNQSPIDHLSLRHIFILIPASFFFVTLFSALPFLLSDLHLGYTDAFFEAMSGITTTGATTLKGLDTFSPGILLWRALLSWTGGIAAIVMGITIFPTLRIGGMQFFKGESSEHADKILPRTLHTGLIIMGTYLLLTALCAIALCLAGMDEFDAICHAMATIATSGVSTHDQSIGYFNNTTIEVVIILFMFLSSLPFILYIQALRGHAMSLYKDDQVRGLFYLLCLTTLVITIAFMYVHHTGFFPALRMAAFHVTSIISTTGFFLEDYSAWGYFFLIAFFMLSVVGGCTGSTSGGIKIFRYKMLYETAKTQIIHLFQPHTIIQPRYNNTLVPSTATHSVMSFFILFSLCFAVIALLLSFFNLDYVSSLSAATASLANLGVGLGPLIGPSGNYAPLPDAAKWLLSFAMLLGRLELFTVLLLFSPYFWRN